MFYSAGKPAALLMWKKIVFLLSLSVFHISQNNQGRGFEIIEIQPACLFLDYIAVTWSSDFLYIWFSCWNIDTNLVHGVFLTETWVSPFYLLLFCVLFLLNILDYEMIFIIFWRNLLPLKHSVNFDPQQHLAYFVTLCLRDGLKALWGLKLSECWNGIIQDWHYYWQWQDTFIGGGINVGPLCF